MRLFQAIFLFLSISGCLPSDGHLTALSALPPGVPCAGGGSGACFFRNAPVRLAKEARHLPSRSLPFFPTIEPLLFVDGARRNWEAPVGTLTDGASIPILFVPLLGNPRSSQFLNAGTLHDAYCGVGNEAGLRFHGDTWQNVHIMFYDALTVAGVPKTKAQIMFSAVWLGGPRWEEAGRGLEQVPEQVLVQAFQSVQAYIESDSPEFAELLRFLEELERTRLAPFRNGIAAQGGDPPPAVPVAAPVPPAGGGVGPVAGGGGASGAVATP